jgi:hypothetical protein
LVSYGKITIDIIKSLQIFQELLAKEEFIKVVNDFDDIIGKIKDLSLNANLKSELTSLIQTSLPSIETQFGKFFNLVDEGMKKLGYVSLFSFKVELWNYIK